MNVVAGSIAALRILANGPLALLGVQLALLPILSQAAAHEPNFQAVPAAAASDNSSAAAVEQLRLSDALADYGQRHADPFALVEAAKLRKDLPAALRFASGAEAAGNDWNALLRRARQISGANPMVTGLIADVRASQSRDIVSIGDDIHLLRKMVHRGSSDRAEVRFAAGEEAIIYVRTDESANLALLVYDEFNNLICTGNSSGQEAICHWRPRWDGRYLVDVQNDTAADIPYQLAINRELVAH